MRKLLPANAVLVGQSLQSDIDWLGLQEGVDFARSVDLSEQFKCYNPRFGNTSFFSLQHEAAVLLGAKPSAGAHDPAQDAQWSVQLYNKFVAPANSATLLKDARQKLLRIRPQPSVAKLLNYQHEGVCMAKFFKEKCICKQP